MSSAGSDKEGYQHAHYDRMVRIEVKEGFMSACDPYHTMQKQLQSRQSGAYTWLANCSTCERMYTCPLDSSTPAVPIPLISSDQFTATNITTTSRALATSHTLYIIIHDGSTDIIGIIWIV